MTTSLRNCACGHCSARYNGDGRTAVTNGHGICLAMSNLDLSRATKSLSDADKAPGTAHYHYPQEWDVQCWVRPHEGGYNPHTRIDVRMNGKNGQKDQKRTTDPEIPNHFDI